MLEFVDAFEMAIEKEAGEENVLFVVKMEISRSVLLFRDFGEFLEALHLAFGDVDSLRNQQLLDFVQVDVALFVRVDVAEIGLERLDLGQVPLVRFHDFEHSRLDFFFFVFFLGINVKLKSVPWHLFFENRVECALVEELAHVVQDLQNVPG